MRRVTKSAALVVMSVWLALSNAPSNAHADADVDSLLAASDGDTIAVLLDIIEDLELDLALADIDRQGVTRERDRLAQEIEAAKPSWFEKIISDPRLWFIVGATLGVLAVDR